MRLLADHARTVLPVALGALDAARTEAERYADEAAGVLGDADETETGGVGTDGVRDRGLAATRGRGAVRPR